MGFRELGERNLGRLDNPQDLQGDIEYVFSHESDFPRSQRLGAHAPLRSERTQSKIAIYSKHRWLYKCVFLLRLQRHIPLELDLQYLLMNPRRGQ